MNTHAIPNPEFQPTRPAALYVNEGNATALIPNIAEIRRAIDTLFEPKQVVELRSVKTPKGTYAGFYRDRDKLAAHAAKISANPTTPAVYWTLQDIDRKLLNRVPDQFYPYIKTGFSTADENVLQYRWLLVDCDPLRNPTNISSTDAEKAEALQVATAVRWYFEFINGWDGYESILADSGNGYHVLVRIDLDASEKSKTLYARVLQALDQQFSTGDETSGTKIDVSVFNQSRICKVYGTVVRKGPVTPERPHRIAHLLEVPDDLPVMPREVLEIIAAEFKPCEAKTSPASTCVPSSHPSRAALEAQALKMEQLLAEANFAHRQRMAYDNGGYKWQLEECPFNPEHKAPDSYTFIRADGKWGFHCSHNHCAQNRWDQFRVNAENIIGHRFKFVEPNSSPANMGDSPRVSESRKVEHPIIQASRDRAEKFDMDSILFDPAMKHAEHEPIFQGFLTVGDSALVIGAKKAEKSLFGLRLAMHIACGKAWCGFACTRPRRVAYLDGENDQQDVNDRYHSLLGEFSSEEQQLIHQNLVVVCGRQYADAGGSLDYLNDRWWDGYAKQTKDCEVHFLDCLYLFHDKESYDNNGLREVMDVLRYRINSMGAGRTVVMLHHSRSLSNDDLRSVDKLSLERLGPINFSETSFGGKVLLKNATLVVCLDKQSKRDEDGEIESQDVYFQFYGRRVPESPLLRFEAADEKFARRLVRTLSKGARKSIMDLRMARGDSGSWESKHEAAKDLKCARSNAYRHLDEMIAKEYLVLEGGRYHLHLTAELNIEITRAEEHIAAHDAAMGWLARYVTNPMKAENVIEIGDEEGHCREDLIEARADAGLIEEPVTDASMDSILMWRPKKKRGAFRKGFDLAKQAAEKRWTKPEEQVDLPMATPDLGVDEAPAVEVGR